MEQNNFNRLSTYEDVFNNFSDVLEEYLSMTDGESIREFNLYAGKGNSLTESDLTSNQLVEEIKKSYLSRNSLTGEIGMLDGNKQYDGIFNIALYMLMCNRLGKKYKFKLNDDLNLDENTKTIYKNKYRDLMAKKHDAATKLIYSLFIYKETENDNNFYYGLKESKGKILLIDLPTYGQISIHFGSQQKLSSILYLANQNINLILEKKLEMGQITEEKFNTIKSKVDNNKIVPKYKNKLYDYVSGIPLDYRGKRFHIAENNLGLSGKLPTELTDNDIKQMAINPNFNTRELFYFAIKSNFSKSQLQKLESFFKERDLTNVTPKSATKKKKKQHKKKSINPKNIGETAISLTTAEERQQVSMHETTHDEIHQDISNEK